MVRQNDGDAILIRADVDDGKIIRFNVSWFKPQMMLSDQVNIEL